MEKTKILEQEIANLKELLNSYRQHVEAVEAERNKLAIEVEMERNFRRQLQRKIISKSEDKNYDN